MKAISKRLSAIEERTRPRERPTAWVAMIDVNGKVKLSHAKSDTIYLESREALQQFIVKNDLQDMAVLIVDIVNAKGEAPTELC